MHFLIEFKFQIETSFTQEHTHSTQENEFTDNKIVLVVEDNYINQIVIKNHLQNLGFVVDLAENGLEALKILEEVKYKLVFMDCSMPEMDGYLCTQKIKKKYGNSAPPIIAVTANSTLENKKKCAESGMDDFITKPYTKDDILRAIRKNIYHTSAKINEAIPSFCRHRLLEEYYGQNKYMCEILSYMLDFVPKSLTSIEINIKDDELHFVYSQTLELKGVLSSIYATESIKIVNRFLEYVNSKDLQRYSAFKELKEKLTTLQHEAREFLDKTTTRMTPDIL
ncbi:MAG: response regulator [Oligoflexales bacterium]